MPASEVLITSGLAGLAAAIFGLEGLRRARLRGNTKVLTYPLWTWSLVPGFVFLAGLLVWSKFWGSEVQRKENPVTVAVFCALFLAAAVVLAKYLSGTVWVDAAGVHARPAFRKPRFIAWDAISAVSTKSGNIMIVGPPGMRIGVPGMMIGIRDLREELASRRPDKLPPVPPRRKSDKAPPTP